MGSYTSGANTGDGDTYTVPSGSDQITYWIYGHQVADGASMSGWTLNSASMTETSDNLQTVSGPGDGGGAAAYITSPATGTASVTQSTTPSNDAGFALTMSDMDTADPIRDDANTGSWTSNTNPTLSYTGAESGDVGVYWRVSRSGSGGSWTGLTSGWTERAQIDIITAPVTIAIYVATRDFTSTVSDSVGVTQPGTIDWGNHEVIIFKGGAGAITLSPDDIAHALALELATITEDAVVSPQDVAHALALDAATITEDATVAPQDVSHSFALDATTISAAANITPQDVAQAFSLEPATVTQNNVVAPQDISMAFALEIATIVSGSALSPQDLAHAFALDAATIAENAVLTPQDVALAFSLENGSISTGGALLLLWWLYLAQTGDVPLYRLRANQPIIVHAFNSSGPVTGDAANITINLSKDGGTATAATNSVAEIGNGAYRVSCTLDESDADHLAITGSSTTSGVSVIGSPSSIYTKPYDGTFATKIATLASQTSFTLTAGSADNDAYNDWVVLGYDQTTMAQVELGIVSDYVGSTRTVTLRNDPGIFTLALGDVVTLQPALAYEFPNVNVEKINDVQVVGAGTTGDKWRA